MTTTVTVETHDWPVAVDVHQSHNFTGPTARGYGNSCRTDFVSKNTKRMFTVSDGTSVTVRELPKTAVSLDDLGSASIEGCSASTGETATA
jgi:hypothetical protein